MAKYFCALIFENSIPCYKFKKIISRVELCFQNVIF